MSVKQKCQKDFCRSGIYDLGTWRRAVMAKQKELMATGMIVADIQQHPEYLALTRCRGNIDDEFLSKAVCDVRYKPTPPPKAPKTKKAKAPKAPKPPKAPKSPKAKLPRCANKTRRHPITKLCTPYPFV